MFFLLTKSSNSNNNSYELKPKESSKFNKMATACFFIRFLYLSTFKTPTETFPPSGPNYDSLPKKMFKNVYKRLVTIFSRHNNRNGINAITRTNSEDFLD